MTSFKDFPQLSYMIAGDKRPFPEGTEGIVSGEIANWRDNIRRELLVELGPLINPKYTGWGTIESDAKVSVYLRILGFKDKKEAWKAVEQLEAISTLRNKIRGACNDPTSTTKERRELTEQLAALLNSSIVDGETKQ